MDIRTYCKKFMIWTAVAVAIILLVLGLCFGKVIEANIYEEVGKWIFMGLLIICSCEALAYTLSQFSYHGSKWDPTSAKYRNAKKGLLPVKYRLGADCLTITGSHAVPRILFREALESIKSANANSAFWSFRSMASLRREWATHNLLYALGVKRDRTADCDLNLFQKWYVRFAYFVVGSIALIVIK